MSATTTKQVAAAPQSGMQRIPMTLDSYQHQSTPLSSRLLLNTFAEQVPPVGRTPIVLLSTPGLSAVPVGGDGLGSGPIHVMNDERPGSVYLISGTHLYMLNYQNYGPWVATDLGDVGVPETGLFGAHNTFYTIAVGFGAVVVCSPPYAYISLENAPVEKIVDTWPDIGASSVSYFDGYFVFTGQWLPTQFFITTLADPTTIDALDFASLDALPDANLKSVALGSSIWFAGTGGWEIWYDSGNADFPFRRRPGGILKRPVGGMKSIAVGNERIFWWSLDNCVYCSNGYQAQRISTHAIERVIVDAGGAAVIDSAYVYEQLGHIFYCINLPQTTVVYDTVTGVWHNRSSAPDGNGPWRPTSATKTIGLPFLGDIATPGRLLLADRTLDTDLGFEVKRQIVLPPLYEGTYRAFCARLEIEMEVAGPHAGDILLEWSDDGGVTYTGSRIMNSGTATQFRKRVYATRLGSFRNRVFRLTAQHAMTIYALDADIVVGGN